MKTKLSVLKIIYCLLLLSSGESLFAQSKETNTANYQKAYQYQIEKINEAIQIDGEIAEKVWQNIPKSSAFWKKFPTDEGRPQRQTEVQICYDEKFIYLAVTAYDSGRAYIQSLKRDIGHDGNDGFAVVLDPTNQKTNGFVFVVNAENAQSEDQLPFPDGEQPSWSWDNKWFSATKHYQNKWTVEMAIPFKSIRYSADKKIWGLNLIRIDTKTNEYSTWTHVPVNFRSMDLGYTGAMIWKESPPKSGSNMVLIPYTTGGVSGDQENGTSTKTTANAGFDAKMALNSSLNLDLTVNPDFSQIEVDQQVTNLSRFNIFFPERRTFFLENADVFASYGIPPIRPFYSRTIGLDKEGNKIPILFGARISGNLGKGTRVGIMNMQTGRKGNYAPENYGAASIHQRVFKRSLVKAYFLNRQNSLTAVEKEKDPLNAWGRNAGIEFTYNNLAGTWSGWGAYHHSFKPGIVQNNAYVDAGFMYSGRNLSVLYDMGNTGTNYYTDMGFVQRINNYDAARDTVIRLGFKQIFSQVGYKWFPKKGKINQYAVNLNNFLVFNPDGSKNEISQELEYNMMFKNTANVFLFANRSDVYLLFPTSFTDASPLPANRYQFLAGGVGFQTDYRKPLSVKLKYAAGEFYNGQIQMISAQITLRKQPHLNIALQAEYNKISFPTIYGSSELLLISPRIEMNFNTKLFWTTFLQYNTQGNNFNINSRFQYRYKPMSDFFLVYTDNYYTSPLLKNKNRALVFKWNYWLNL